MKRKITHETVVAYSECQRKAFLLLSGQRGDIVSLLPLTSVAEGVTTWGLKYDLSGITLKMGSTRGVSNELVWPEAQVGIATGMLVAFLERRER